MRTFWQCMWCLAAGLPVFVGQARAADGEAAVPFEMAQSAAGPAADDPHRDRAGEDKDRGAAGTKATPAINASLTVEDMLAKLRALNITASVSEQDLRDWLGNPEYTPYPAVAAGLIGLLGDRRLARTLDIDVIIYDYENSPGMQSPRSIEDVDLAVLTTVTLKAYNARYGIKAGGLSEITR